MGRVLQLYLATYNTAQLIGWSLALQKVVQGLLESSSSTFKLAGPVVSICQGTALLETLHAATGVVRGSPATAFLQWFGRANILFALLDSFEEAQHGWPTVALFGAWALSEVIRYPWYIFAQFREPPYILTWLRYTMFIPLYPVGVASEIAIILKCLPLIKASRIYSIELPNRLNVAFSYYYFCLFALLVLYPIAFPWLFSTLLHQRKRKLGPGPKGKKLE